jgi:hypothetical protein
MPEMSPSLSLSWPNRVPNPLGACEGLPVVASISIACPTRPSRSSPGNGGGDSALGRESRASSGLYAVYSPAGGGRGDVFRPYVSPSGPEGLRPY